MLRCDDSQPGAVKCTSKEPFLHVRTDVGYGGTPYECTERSGTYDALPAGKKCTPTKDYNGLNSAELTTEFVQDRWSTAGAQCNMWYQYKKVDC